MADRYWVGGTGTWNATLTTNWSATSGGAGGASVPTAADNVIFNSASSGASYTVTTTAVTLPCLSLTVSPPAAGTFTISGGGLIDVYANATISSVSVAWNHSGTITFRSTTTAAINISTTVVSAGVTIATTGTATLGAALTFGAANTGGFRVTSGTFAANNFNVAAPFFIWSGGNVNLGSGNISCTGGTSITAPTGSTFTTTTGVFQYTGVFGTANSFTANGTAALALPVSLIASLSPPDYELNLSNGNTITTLICPSPTVSAFASVQLRLPRATTINTLTLGTAGADPHRRILLIYDVPNPSAAILITNPTARTLINTDFRFIQLSVASSGTSLGNAGGNANITFTAAKTVYWNLAVGGAWGQNAFATTSGGAPNVANWPLPQDTVIFENTGLNSLATVSISAAYRMYPSMTSATRTLAMTIADTTSAAATEDMYFAGSSYSFSSSTVVTSATNGYLRFINPTNFQALNSAAPFAGLYQGFGIGAITLTANSFVRQVYLTRNNLTLNNFTLTCSEQFSYGVGSLGRGIAFGATGAINLTALTGTLISGGSATNFTTTGTGSRDFNITGATTVGTRTLNIGTIGEANVYSVNVTAGAGTLTLSGLTFRNFNCTGFSGSISGVILTVYGDVTWSTTVTLSCSLNFAKTSGTQTYQPNGRSLGGSIEKQSGTTGSTLTFLGSATGITNLTSFAGTVQLNNFTHSANNVLFGSGSAATTLDWGSVGSTITLIANNSRFENARATQSSVTWTGAGTKTINFTSTATTGTRVCYPGTNLNESTAPNVNFTGAPAAGTASVTLTNALGTTHFKSLTFAAAGNYIWNTVASNSAIFYGNLTLTSTVTVNYAGTVTFSNTSGTAVLTSAGKTFLGAIGRSGVGGTTQLADAATTTSVTGFFLTSGTWNLNNFTLTAPIFASGGTAPRSLAFGTGSLNLNSTSTGTVISIATGGTGFSVSGTPTVNVTGATASGITRTFTIVGTPAAASLNINVTAGASSSTLDFGTSANVVRSLNLTGYSGSLGSVTNPLTMYGSLTIPATLGGGSGIWGQNVNWQHTSGTATLITNGISVANLTMNGAGGTLQFGSAVTFYVAFPGILTLTAGTINFNGFNGTFKSFSSSNSNVRTLNIGSNQILFTQPNAAVWDVATSTNFTLTATGGTVQIQAPAGTYTFNGGGLSYPTVLFVNAGVNPTFILTGNNTFVNFGSASGNRTLSLAAGSTQTITGAFNFAGLAGSPLQYGTINSTVAGTQATLSKASGTVTANLLNIKDSNATGGATWDAYTNGNNINSGNNSGWLFAAVVFLANAFFNFF